MLLALLASGPVFSQETTPEAASGSVPEPAAEAASGNPAAAADTDQTEAGGLPDGWYQGKRIADIPFYGLHSVDPGELENVFASYIGQPFSDDLYVDILQRLYGLEYFTDIVTEVLPADASLEEILLTFTVTERPVVRRIVFTGNQSANL